MYVVICINCDNSNPTDFDSLDWDKIVYGWLDKEGRRLGIEKLSLWL